MNVSERIKERRKAKGLTQSDLALMADISLDMVKSMETGRTKPSIDTLDKIADALECSSDYLLGRVDEPDQHQTYTWDQLIPKIDDALKAVDRRFGLTDENGLSSLLSRFPRTNEVMSEQDIKDVDKVIEDLKNGLTKILESSEKSELQRNKGQKDNP